MFGDHQHLEILAESYPKRKELKQKLKATEVESKAAMWGLGGWSIFTGEIHLPCCAFVFASASCEELEAEVEELKKQQTLGF